MSWTVKAWVETPKKMSSVRQRRGVTRNCVCNGLLSEFPDTHAMSNEERSQVWKTVFDAVDIGV